MAATVDDYLITEVRTAAPQKLQLMLIEAALRLALQARHYLGEAQLEKASRALLRGQGILAELLSGVSMHSPDEASQRVAGVYLFVYRNLVNANLERSQERLNDAVRILEIERETWRQVCQQLGSQSDAAELGQSFVA